MLKQLQFGYGTLSGSPYTKFSQHFHNDNVTTRPCNKAINIRGAAYEYTYIATRQESNNYMALKGQYSTRTVFKVRLSGDVSDLIVTFLQCPFDLRGVSVGNRDPL